ncbi:MAG: hypothetical protein ACI9U2_004255 [Bradymonadia bacterium]|jgi:hypothetical protein
MMHTNAWVLAALVGLAGCVVDESSREDGDERIDAAQQDAFFSDGSILEPEPQPEAQPDAEPGSMEPGSPEPESPEPESPEPEPADLCDATCTQLYSCFESDCAELAGAEFLDNLCEGLCDAPARAQRNLIGLECGDYLVALTDFIPELGELCSDEPPPFECAPVCEFLADCSAEVDRASCPTFCRGFDADQLACLTNATDAAICLAAFACFDDEEEPPPPIDPEELCTEVCQRRNVCVSRECAPGTLQPGDGRACVQSCLRAPPSEDEAFALSQQRCGALVAALNEDPEFAERCAADDMQACAQLCEDVVGDCLERDACLAACPAWNDTNLTCLRFTGGQCNAVEVCVNSPDAQRRCETSCARWSECLGEACPPRILPPTLGVNCAAGCLFDPPEAAEVEAYLNLECAEVRAELYETNRELAPICEGDPEFNPGPDECVAFCERGLEACIGIGGRNFCLGACASLTREEYECALAAGENCEEINACLPE